VATNLARLRTMAREVIDFPLRAGGALGLSAVTNYERRFAATRPRASSLPQFDQERNPRWPCSKPRWRVEARPHDQRVHRGCHGARAFKGGSD
jgi:hypothetical protein